MRHRIGSFICITSLLCSVSAFSIVTSRCALRTKRSSLRSEPADKEPEVSLESEALPVTPSVPGALARETVREDEPTKPAEAAAPTIIQGNSLRTWSFPSEDIQRVQLLIRTQGRPLHSNVVVWQGPDNDPQKIGIYSEDGIVRPFCCIAETPHGQNAVAVYNTGSLEFPLLASVDAIDASVPLDTNLQDKVGRTIQGGALHTYPFLPNVQSVAVFLKTNGRPLEARIELLQGPNNNKQVMEIESENGKERPFYVVIASPGVGNVIRVLNTAPMEYPLTAVVEPYEMDLD
ncbi:hypothetical protein FisN_19Hh307 [Fistulifera solaris]|uniref:Transmembrane protein n=1 Tax=Fistulifera solaris TaxID=1519565 RepID=A0A1Z5K082_FISSO|nr:hypothetical protein FisN_19Hh307 [Fistulifera solaris]|eukprot:GAX19720.1 hypothetical protein FisN_19Hh307 [Fistulifera solaris]